MKPHTILSLLCFILLLLITTCAVFPPDGIRIGSVSVQLPPFRWTWITHADTIAPVYTIDTNELVLCTDTLSVTTITEDTVAAVDTLDTRWHLRRFYLSLARTDSTAVRVVYYGDSQIEGDRMTKNVRRVLQDRFGGSGIGLQPLHQAIPSQAVTQTLIMNGVQQSAQQGPKRYLAYGSKKNRRDNNVYGPMAQVTVMNDSLVQGSEEVSVQFASSQPFSLIRILREKDSLIQLPQPVRNHTLRLKGKGDIYGVSLESPAGVTVDNIPMRGCAGTIFTSVHPKKLQQFFSDTHTHLIILQYGGNVVPYIEGDKGVRQYAERIRKQIRYFRKNAPDADILFIGPSDMLTLKDGQQTSYPVLPVMDAALQQVAEDERIAYWSLFQAMGGAGSMNRWIANGRAGNDGIHFTRQGAEKAGDMLAEWLMEGVEMYLTTNE